MGSNSKSAQTERPSKFYLHPAVFSDMHLCYVGQLGALKESTEQNFDLGTNTLLKQIIFFLCMSTSFLSQN